MFFYIRQWSLSKFAILRTYFDGFPRNFTKFLIKHDFLDSISYYAKIRYFGSKCYFEKKLTSTLLHTLLRLDSSFWAQVTKTQDEKNQTLEAMAEALANRNEENAKFKQALKDDAAAVGLIAQAVEVLSGYYSLIQKKQPEYNTKLDLTPS